MNLNRACSILLIFGLAFATVDAGFEEDLVTSLPGATLSFNLYSGYIQVTGLGQSDRFYHFMLTESKSNPAKDPLILWLNGGPGCSSMLGALSENGPFIISEIDGKMQENVDSWNANATVLYLESPAPVGYSYGGSATMGDNSTRDDNYAFLQGFFLRYPQYKSHDFYITGESYAGQYIPQLANKILTENDLGENPNINLKGFMVGNPSGISSGEWAYSGYKFFNGHGFISDDELAGLGIACNKSLCGENDACTDMQFAIWEDNLKGVNPYNVLSPCLGDGPGPKPDCFTSEMAVAVVRDENLENFNGHLGQTFVPCMSYNHTLAYMNSAEVRKALHISEKAFDWTVCSSHLTYNQYQGGTPNLYRTMVGRIKMLVYSGDLDSCVPFLGTRRGVENLGLKRIRDARPWFAFDPKSQSSQIAGYAEHFEGVTYTTVRGAGHMVPADKPASMLQLLNSFVVADPTQHPDSWL